jgi:hypothetical protein
MVVLMLLANLISAALLAPMDMGQMDTLMLLLLTLVLLALGIGLLKAVVQGLIQQIMLLLTVQAI